MHTVNDRRWCGANTGAFCVYGMDWRRRMHGNNCVVDVTYKIKLAVLAAPMYPQVNFDRELV